jgi:pimeloyl-ACP methyl ester carboxylesterase
MLAKKSVNISLNLESVNLNHGKAAYLEMGQGTPLIMLHGFLGESRCWAPLIERLKAQFHCISVDLLGFGESSQPKITYNVPIEVAFLHEFVTQLQLKEFYIVGHSFGGWVASGYALKYPEFVKGLMLAAPAGIRDDSFCGRYDVYRPLLWDTPLIDWGLKLAKKPAQFFGKTSELEQLLWFRKNLMEQPAARSYIMDRLRPEDAIDTVEKEIHQIQCPTLVITGDQDETIPLWHSQTYSEEIANASLEIIPNATHALPQDYSPEMAELILKFMAKQRVEVERS